MSQTLPSLRIARLLLQKGDPHEARVAAEDARYDALILEDRRLWLDATSLFWQCCQELEDLNTAEKPLAEVIAFLQTSPERSLQALAETILASWLLALSKTDEALGYLQSAINKATESRDLEVLCRALLIQTFVLASDPKQDAKALEQLTKLDVLLKELNASDIAFSAQLLKSHVYLRRQQYDLAGSVLWNTYDAAKNQGNNLVTAGCLSHMARLYRDQNQTDEYRLYAELALRGVDHAKTPRLYRQIHAICPPETIKKTPLYDFQVDEVSRKVKEKNKGSIDFKNQHLLFEMALLFIKTPGVRYTKDDLAQLIWNQNYEPDLHDNLIYVSIKRLRTLLEPELDTPRYILRDRKGYYFNPQSVVQHKSSHEVSL